MFDFFFWSEQHWGSAIIITVYKPGGSTLQEDKLKQCMERAKQRVDEVMPILSEAAKVKQTQQ